MKIDFYNYIALQIAKNKKYSNNDILNQKYPQNFKMENIAKSYLPNSNLIINHTNTGITIMSILSKLATFLPIQDFKTQLSNDDEKNIKIMKKYFDNYIDDQTFIYHKNLSQNISNMSLEEKLIYHCTKGLASHLMKYDKDLNIYIVDLLYLEKFEVRQGFCKYGAKIFINDNLTVNKIILFDNTEYTCESEYFQYAYNIFSSSLMLHSTIKDHALFTHFLSAGNMSAIIYELQGIISDELLNFIKPFIYRTTEINQTALETLLCKSGIITRLFALTDNGLENLIKYYIQNIENEKYELFNDSPHNYHYSNMTDYYDIIKHFVKNYIHNLEKNNELCGLDLINQKLKNLYFFKDIPLITNVDYFYKSFSLFIFIVSYWHEYIGNKAPYIIMQNIMRPKNLIIYKNENLDSEQTYIQTLLLTLSTTMPIMPKITDANIYSSKYEYLWKDLRAKLGNLKFMDIDMNMDFIDISVSI